MKALIYARVSTASQAEEGTSLDSQVSECRLFAESRGFEITHVTKEIFSGAYLFDRPLLNERREAVRRGDYDVVVVYSIDRLSRDIAHLAIICDEFERHNTKLLFVTENLDETSEGKLLRSVKSYVAEVEREKIKERCVRGKRTKILQGKFVPASNLYGYSFNKQTGKREMIEPEAEVVRRIFRDTASGTSLRRLSIQLNAEGVPSPSATRRVFKDGRIAVWGISTLRRILTEPAYAGKTIAWRFKRKTGFKQGKRTTVVVLRDRSEWVELPGITPALVEFNLWESAGKKLSENSGERVRNEKLPYLFRGLIFCAACGKKMYADAEKGNRFYRCSSRIAGTSCGSKRVNAEKAENKIWQTVKKAIDSPNRVENILSRHRAAGGDVKRNLAALASERGNLKKVEAEIKTLAVRAATVDNSVWAIFQEQLKIHQAARDKSAARITELETLLTDDSEKRIEILALLNKFQTETANASFEVRRLILESFNLKVFANGGSYEVYADFPF